MKKNYEKPQFELEVVEVEDVIAISNAGSTNDGSIVGLPNVLGGSN